MWTSDLFMETCVEADTTWTLMCPNGCPGLDEIYGKTNSTTIHLLTSGKEEKTIRARELWEKMTESQIETGTHMLYKDAANRKSNQRIWEQFVRLCVHGKLWSILLQIVARYVTWRLFFTNVY